MFLAVLVGCSGGGGSSDEPNDSLATATPLGSIGSSTRTGAIVGEDRDYFEFSAAVDGLLRIALNVAAGADFDLALFNGPGARLATTRADNRSPQVGPVETLFAWVRKDAVYFVEVRGFAGSSGAYRFTIEIDAPTASSSTAVDSLAEARSFHAAVTLPDGRALVAGGTADPSSQTNAIVSALDSTELFDPSNGEFTSGPALGAPRFAPTATLLPTGRVLIAGGDLTATADLFDPATDGVDASIAMTGGIRVLATATLLRDGRVLIAGGTTLVFNPLPSARTLDTTTIFDPKTRTFSSGPRMRAPRTSHAATLAPDGRVLLTGGVGRSDSEWIDVAGATSIDGPALTGVRDDHTATLLGNGRVLLAGGQNGSGRSLDTAEILDPGVVAFRLIPDRMADPRADHQSVLLRDGSVLLLGGEDDPAGGPDVILTSVDRFDPTTELFAPAPALVVPRDDHRVAPLLDGRILVTGGEDVTSTSIRDVELYLPD